MAKVVHSKRSRSDLKEIWLYIAERSERAADNVLRRIHAKIEGLKDFPEQGVARDDLAPGIRQLGYPPYLIFYRHTADDVAEIIAVVHGRRDLPSAL